MKTLFILNDAPYGSERTYNGIRLAGALSRQDGHEVQLFLMGDATAAVHRLQKVPSGHYNLESLLSAIARHSGSIGVCGSCMDARGIASDDLMEGAHRGSMDQLAEWSAWADKVIVF
ncbi:MULTISPECIES: DsrE/DsrF/TusD sulfur relay family protein [unclassified Variovorax]|uniref:DsrE/DsrF/TusD sulfur relay family protein n=1 Tax=unclassified Variovorax TaxID=663243 RepID=UPI003ED11613